MLLRRPLTLLAAIALTAIALTAIGCADGTLPEASSPGDPSNPAAPEAPFVRPAPLGPPIAAPSASAPAGEVIYVCPMHPQIVRDAPGTCPICGMTLVAHPKGDPPRARPAP
jgi:Heavy metal binding domain